MVSSNNSCIVTHAASDREVVAMICIDRPPFLFDTDWPPAFAVDEPSGGILSNALNVAIIILL